MDLHRLNCMGFGNASGTLAYDGTGRVMTGGCDFRRARPAVEADAGRAIAELGCGNEAGLDAALLFVKTCGATTCAA